MSSNFEDLSQKKDQVEKLLLRNKKLREKQKH